MTGSLNGFPKGFDAARGAVDALECSVALFFDGKTQKTAQGRGIAPLLSLFDETPEAFRSAAVADKIIGKAAAMLLVHAGVAAAYGAVMSEAGRDMLASHGVAWACGTLVPYIVNRDGTAMCPVEQSVEHETEPEAGLARIRRRVEELKAGKNTGV